MGKLEIVVSNGKTFPNTQKMSTFPFSLQTDCCILAA